MNKDALLNLGLGAAGVFLLYAIWRSQQRTAPAAFGRFPSIVTPDHGVSLDLYDPAKFISTRDLINGTISDYYGTRNAK